MMTPKLIVVTGQPASGKTTLAHLLARAIRCPALCRDEFKEGLVNTLYPDAMPDDQANLQVYNTFFRAIELLLNDGITVVAEAAFQHPLWLPKLEPMQAIAQLRIVLCSIDPVLATTRFVQRAAADPDRGRYHKPRPMLEGGGQDPVLLSPYVPPRLEVPTLAVDTSDGYRPSLEAIVEFALRP